ncbi:hypothetical protein HF888_08770 [Bermanella marisrubri]|uniref:Transcriptional regulator SutA RNAP-binding domain-containing protein n=1 Tax=Bermanella marisrubri TaxID=207949 RepID=Q1N6S5_9GAMM|nr:hypothetical protein [Bermanella marisrubri]EAT13517.1 hypothetical protein RED65_09004 [Oceanobacter sp. RED65] [Bermanella marisrubri]QIZ84317.1 hypothetical protein HF888_08770 [Bermanella marisrubri]
MKKLPSKKQRRAQLDKEIENYLNHGGQIDKVPQGTSGRENPEAALLPVLFAEKAHLRTDARPALQQLDTRKNKKKLPPRHKARRKKKPIYDDFGEILRWVWDDK